jgi:glucose-6-phosphate-specific signal transduction histidine kinase
VATNLSAMVLQAEVAQRLLGPDPSRADDAMSSIEEVGRETLDQMRVVLGVLRSYEDPADRAPQPGVGQIHSLVESAREDSRRVELQVEGEPAPLPASVNLGVYRIIEDALSTTAPAAGGIELSLVFGEREVDLTVTASRPVTPAWPTPAMCEWVALCEGKIGVGSDPGPAERLHVRLPREREGLPA